MSNTKLPPPVHSLWLHLKTSHSYVIVGHCILEATGEPGILYSDVTGNKDVWARAREEFLDGRFVPINIGMEGEQ